MAVDTAIHQLERRRFDLLRRLRAAEARMEQIHTDMATLAQLEMDVLALKGTLTQLDAAITTLDPNWQPRLPRGRPAGGRR